METTITLNPSVFEMLKSLAVKKGFNNITISLSKKKANSLRKEASKQTKARIEKSIAEIENGSAEFISFTGEEFEAFYKTISGKN